LVLDTYDGLLSNSLQKIGESATTAFNLRERFLGLFVSKLIDTRRYI